METRKVEVVEDLKKAQAQAACPAMAAWEELGSLVDVLDGAPDPDDARLRLRAALRRLIDSVWLMIVPRGSTRMCAVQVWFAGGKRHRDYLIYHRPAHNTFGHRSCGALGKRYPASSSSMGLPSLGSLTAVGRRPPAAPVGPAPAGAKAKARRSPSSRKPARKDVPFEALRNSKVGASPAPFPSNAASTAAYSCGRIVRPDTSL